MANHPLYGDVLKMGRQILDEPTESAVHEFNSRYGALGYGRRLLEGVNEAERERLGLSLSASGRLILERETSPTSDWKSENARAQRKPTVPTVHRNSSLYVLGYGKHIPPGAVAAAWKTKPAVADRIDTLRRAPSIRDAPVSVMAHNGLYTGSNSMEAIDGHVAKITQALCSPATGNSRIRWGHKMTPNDFTYSVEYASASQTPVVVRNARFAGAMEVGALLGYTGGSRFLSQGRQYELFGETCFRVDADLIKQVAPSIEVGESQELSGNEATDIGDFIRLADADILAPLSTEFYITQEVLGYAQTPPND